MPRARIIKPEFWDDEVLAQSTSRDARLTFIGMWNHSDDYAVVKGNAIWLKSKIFPYEEIKPDTFQKWLNELEKGRWILPFVVDGAKYYYIQAFTKHQIINRPSQQRNPEPPQQILEDSRSTHGVLTDEIEVEREVKEKKKPLRGQSSLCRFEDFWSAYPKKKSKGDAEKAWTKINPSESLIEKILSAVQRATTSTDWTKEGGQYIPYPATWLNKKGWEDEIDSKAPHAKELWEKALDGEI